MQQNGKQLLAFLLVVAMVVSMLPMRVFAQEQETLPQATPEVQQEETQPETILPVVTDPEDQPGMQPGMQPEDQPGEQPGMQPEDQPGDTDGEDPALERIEASAITIIEGTHGYISQSWDEETGKMESYYYYNPWELLDEVSVYLYFADGSCRSVDGEGFYHNNYWYSFMPLMNQGYENQWTVGNTYTMTVSAMDKSAEVSVTIIPSAVQSLKVEPITIMEGSCGYFNSDVNPETGMMEEYYVYEPYSLLGRTQFCVEFQDGRSWSGYGDEGYYDSSTGKYQYLDGSAHQSFASKWTAGNIYTLDVFFMGYHVQVPVTIIASPVVSITAEPTVLYEGVGGFYNTYYPDDGNACEFFVYAWWNRVNYRVQFQDGTSTMAYNGSGFYYDGQYYELEVMDDQGYENQWTAGNTYYATIKVLGASAQVTITVEASPVQSVVFDPIVLEEYQNGYWKWGGDSSYYYYYWDSKIAYTIQFRDGTQQRGTYWDDVYYDGMCYSIDSYSDNQDSENRWLKGNSYPVRILLEGTWYDTTVTIASTVERDGFLYIASGEQAIITGCTLKNDLLVIPETIDGYRVVSVTSLGNALMYTKQLRIPDSVTMLSDDLFDVPYENEKPLAASIALEKLVVGKGVGELTAQMLKRAGKLKEIQVAAENPALCSIDGVLYNKQQTCLLAYPAAKEALHRIPNTVSDIEALFAGGMTCANVQFGENVRGYKLVDGIIYTEDMRRVMKATPAATGTYVMPQTVTDIAYYAFSGSNLSAIEVSPSVTFLSYRSFQDAVQLEEITIPNSVDEIRNFESSGCVNLKKVHITNLKAWSRMSGGGGLLYYAHDLYLNGEKIVNLVIPESVTQGVYGTSRIGYQAFANGSFETVSIPKGITDIEEYAFDGCENLKAVYIDDLTAWARINFVNEKSNPLYYAGDLYLNGEKLTELTVPKAALDYESVPGVVYAVDKFTFYNINLERLVVPSYVYTIGLYAFTEASIDEIVLEEGVSKILYAAFENTTIPSLDLPDSLWYMEGNAFKGCEQLAELTIGAGLRRIQHACFRNSALKTVVIPAQVREIESLAFADSNLTDVEFRGDDMWLALSAFKNCPLRSLELGDNFYLSGNDMTSGLTIAQIRHPAAVTDLSYGLYAGNPNLVSVYIPDTAQYIDNFAFSRDTNLSHVLYGGTQEQWNQIGIGSQELNRATIHYGATGDEVTVTQDCTTIRLYCSVCDAWETVYKKNASHIYGVDGACTVCGDGDLWKYQEEEGTITITGYQGIETDVVIPAEIDGKRVTAFTASVFANNNQLTSVVLPDGITRIPYGAFRGCTALKSVTLGANVAYINAEAFMKAAALEKINLPEGLITIGDGAFAYCENVDLSIPQTVRYIGIMAFYRCYNLTQAHIPEGVTEIAYQTFTYCHNLQALTIPSTVTAIGYFAFQQNERLEEVVIPASVQRIDNYAFFMSEVKTVVFQGDQPRMGYDVFEEKGISFFYPAENETWQYLPEDSNRWYACSVPTISQQPDGQAATLSVVASGHRLCYQWYYAAPGEETFTAVGSNSCELVLSAAQDVAGAKVYCLVTDILGQTITSETVTLGAAEKPAVEVVINGQTQGFASLNQALEAAPAGSRLVLFGDSAEDVSVTSNVVMDLNGYQLSGNITVAEGSTLLLKDSKTDDYTVLDQDGYGKIAGTITGVAAAEGYMMIVEEDGVSFHRVDLTVTDMTMRSSQVGVYYKSNFAGDELVAQNVARYGVALRLDGAPTEDNLGIMSWFTDFAPGADANAANGTLLYGVMKQKYTDEENARRAELPVYGRAYVLTQDGQYIFGDVVSRSLRQQVELIDGMWNDLSAQQQDSILSMYVEYQAVMDRWNIPSIQAAAQ